MKEKRLVSRRHGLLALGLTLSVTLMGTAVTHAAASPAAGAQDALVAEGTPYRIVINNNSELDNMNAIVFQAAPKTPTEGYQLAWLVKKCHKHTQVIFNWEVEYSFVWGAQGDLGPGVNYQAGAVLPADLDGNNAVPLSYDGAYYFGDTGPGDKPGTMTVHQDDSVPGSGQLGQGSVGIGMSGAGTFVVPTEPKTGASFTVTPTYWIAFGSHQPGEVVTTDVLTEPYKLQFPNGDNYAEATFDGRDWKVQYGKLPPVSDPSPSPSWNPSPSPSWNPSPPPSWSPSPSHS